MSDGVSGIPDSRVTPGGGGPGKKAPADLSTGHSNAAEMLDKAAISSPTPKKTLKTVASNVAHLVNPVKALKSEVSVSELQKRAISVIKKNSGKPRTEEEQVSMELLQKFTGTRGKDLHPSKLNKMVESVTEALLMFEPLLNTEKFLSKAVKHALSKVDDQNGTFNNKPMTKKQILAFYELKACSDELCSGGQLSKKEYKQVQKFLTTLYGKKRFWLKESNKMDSRGAMDHLRPVGAPIDTEITFRTKSSDNGATSVDTNHATPVSLTDRFYKTANSTFSVTTMGTSFPYEMKSSWWTGLSKSDKTEFCNELFEQVSTFKTRFPGEPTDKLNALLSNFGLLLLGDPVNLQQLALEGALDSKTADFSTLQSIVTLLRTGQMIQHVQNKGSVPRDEIVIFRQTLLSPAKVSGGPIQKEGRFLKKEQDALAVFQGYGDRTVYSPTIKIVTHNTAINLVAKLWPLKARAPKLIPNLNDPKSKETKQFFLTALSNKIEDLKALNNSGTIPVKKLQKLYSWISEVSTSGVSGKYGLEIAYGLAARELGFELVTGCKSGKDRTGIFATEMMVINQLLDEALGNDKDGELLSLGEIIKNGECKDPVFMKKYAKEMWRHHMYNGSRDLSLYVHGFSGYKAGNIAAHLTPWLKTISELGTSEQVTLLDQFFQSYERVFPGNEYHSLELILGEDLSDFIEPETRSFNKQKFLDSEELGQRLAISKVKIKKIKRMSKSFERLGKNMSFWKDLLMGEVSKFG